MADRPTIHDVAAMAGCSVATVSKALTGDARARIAAATRTRILAAAAELGYQADRVARSLASGRTRLVGVLIPDLASPFYAAIVDGIEKECAIRDLAIILAHSRGTRSGEQRQVQLLLAQRVDGLICIVASEADGHCREWLAPLVARKVPCVVVDEVLPDLAIDTVVSDDRSGSRAATELLLSKGHRRIGLLAAGTVRSTARERLEGYRLALEAAGIAFDPALVAGDSYDPVHVPASLDRILAAAPRPTALLASNDTLAAAAFAHATARGLTVPRDLALVGYHNHAHFGPALGLTSVDQDMGGMGRNAVDLLARRIAEPGAPAITARRPTNLVVRSSSG